jgi:hypothetical protein
LHCGFAEFSVPSEPMQVLRDPEAHAGSDVDGSD